MKPARLAPATAAFAAALLLLAGFAFWPTYLSKPWPPIDRYTHAHAALGSAWLLVLIVQPLLIHARRRALHRLIGRLSPLLAAAFVVSGVLLAHHRLSRMDEATFQRDAPFLYLPLVMAALFAIAFGLGWRWRRSMPVHGRAMASTAAFLVDPVIARAIAFHFPPLPALLLYQAITFSLITALLVWMWRSLPPAVPGAAAFARYCAGAIAALALFFALPSLEPWTAFGQWFRTLPLT